MKMQVSKPIKSNIFGNDVVVSLFENCTQLERRGLSTAISDSPLAICSSLQNIGLSISEVVDQLDT